MGIERDFRVMMPHLITLQAQSSLDAYGKATFAAGSVYRCRLVYDQRMVRDTDGREVVQQGKALLYGYALATNVKYRITLPDGTTPKVLSVKQLKDEHGDHHTEIGFG